MNKEFVVLLLVSFVVLSCQPPNPNVDVATGEDELKSLEVGRQIDKNEMAFYDEIYVPIYSDIYVDAQNQKSLLAATLSIRNTSLEDTLFISKIDYFNTTGNLVRSYLDQTISLPPMGTINYVIDKEDDTGGSGANFMVALNAKDENVKPLIQAVMIGLRGNIGFSFSTDGYSVKKD